MYSRNLARALAPLASHSQSSLRTGRFIWKPTARNFSVITEKLESLGDSISSAVVVSWSKNPGDAVKEDDVIAVVETDKVTMDIRSKKNGVFVKGLAAAQAEISVGSPFYELDTSSSAVSAAKTPSLPAEEKKEAKSSPQASTSSAEEISVPVPVMGESITTGVLAQWHVKEGDSVKTDQVIANVETDKVNVDVRSPHSGKITKFLAQAGKEVTVANPLFKMIPGATDGNVAAQQQEPKKEEKPAQKQQEPARQEPPKAAKHDSPASSKPSAPLSVPSAPTAGRPETRVKMTRMRQRIATRLKDSQNTAAMLTTFQEVDMGNLIELRNKYKDDFEKAHGVKLGFMSAFVRAAANALQELPAVNAVIDDATQEVVYRNYVDVSVAVASPTGLVVPVLRNVEKMNFADIEKSIADYGKKAKDGKLAIEDMTGGTFTISNGGVFGSLFGTPIINPPQSAILGMHATKMRAMVVNGKIEARPMMYLALTYDHRLIDGREAVTFLKSIANKIEDPGRLLLVL